MSEVNLEFTVGSNPITITVDPNEITFTPTDVQLTMTTAGLVVPAGPQNSVQFNDNQQFAGSSEFTFDNVSNTLTVTNLVTDDASLTSNISNIHISGGVNGYVLQTDGAGNLSWTAQTGGGGGGNGTPGGSNTQVQFNDAGTFGGDAGFTYDNVTNDLHVPNQIVANAANLGGATITTTGIVTPGYYGNITGANVISSRTMVANVSLTTDTVVANTINAGAIVLNTLSSNTASISNDVFSNVIVANLINPNNSNNTITMTGDITMTGAANIANTITTSNKVKYQTSGTVTQATSRATGVTLNAPSGRIVLFSGACAANTTQTFVLENSYITTKSMILVSWEKTSYLGSFSLAAMINPSSYPTGGFCQISLRNNTSTSLTEQPVIRFLIVETNI